MGVINALTTRGAPPFFRPRSTEEWRYRRQECAAGGSGRDRLQKKFMGFINIRLTDRSHIYIYVYTQYILLLLLLSLLLLLLLYISRYTCIVLWQFGIVSAVSVFEKLPMHPRSRIPKAEISKHSRFDHLDVAPIYWVYWVHFVDIY